MLSLPPDMFTIEQLNDLHDRLGTMETFPEYVRALRSAGVRSFDSYLFDGHSEFFGSDGHMVQSGAAHETLTIADISNQQSFLDQLHLHSQHKTSYLEMSKGLAESGVERWSVDTTRMTMTYYDNAGNQMLVEALE
jgi:uncharacterized protein YbcV (DUF1398 family)